MRDIEERLTQTHGPLSTGRGGPQALLPVAPVTREPEPNAPEIHTQRVVAQVARLSLVAGEFISLRVRAEGTKELTYNASRPQGGLEVPACAEALMRKTSFTPAEPHRQAHC